MAQLRHKILGDGEIVRRDGNIITVKFEKRDKEMPLSIPESFVYGIYELGEDLQNEVDAAIQASREAVRKEREANATARAELRARADSSAKIKGTRRSGGSFVKIERTGDFAKDFETFMKKNGYSEKTKSKNKSTIYAYVNEVKSVMESESLDWDELFDQISNVASVYDTGGAKQEIGEKSNRTVINALRRFEDFVNNSIPPQTASNKNS